MMIEFTISLFFLGMSIFLMSIGLRYYEVFLEQGDCIGSVIFYVWLGLWAF